ncbi:MAG: TRAP transporter substrate-binding protein [Alphaproteobacteria bacterium]
MLGYARGAVFAAAAAALFAAGSAQAQTQLKAVGTWGNLSNWQHIEKPFWEKDLPEASGGSLTGDAKPLTELGLRGFEVMRLLKLGVFDVAHALPIYVAEDAVIEGIDLAGVATDFKTARAVADAYRDVLADALSKNYSAKLLNVYPFPAQVFYCRTPISGIADLKGKKVRVQGASQGDFVEAVGGAPVTIAFAEVVPAMQKGVVDCGITGTMPGYKAKWYEVASHVFTLPVGFTITFTAINENSWNKLDEKQQEALLKASAAFEDKGWEVIEAENEEGIACGTGTGECTVGAPGKMTLVKPGEADVKARETALNEGVLRKWAQRCGADCVKQWNETVGKVVDLQAGG